MKLPSAIAAASVAVAVAAVAFAIGYGISDDQGPKSAASKPQVLGQVFARTPDASTTTTTSPAPQAPPTSKAATPAATATTAKAATTQVRTTTQQTSATTPATVITSGECGTGTAQASVESQIAPRERTASTTYDTFVKARVDNGISKAIQIDTLSVRFTYHDRPSQDYVLSGASGAVIQPGTSGTFTPPPVNTPVPPDSVSLASFAFHTAGQPQCAGKPA
jgi:hypothetical protein